MQNCPKCGANSFIVTKWEIYTGEIIDGKLLYSTLKVNGIDAITCRKCGVEINQSDIEVEYVG